MFRNIAAFNIRLETDIPLKIAHLSLCIAPKTGNSTSSKGESGSSGLTTAVRRMTMVNSENFRRIGPSGEI